MRRDVAKVESIIDVLAYLRQGRRYILRLKKRISDNGKEERVWMSSRLLCKT